LQRNPGGNKLKIPNNKKIVCITGSVWTGKQDAPRHMLVKEGFVRPQWFTTGRALSDVNSRFISAADYHQAFTDENVLAHMRYSGVDTGILKTDFQDAMDEAETGVLVVGFQEIVAQVAKVIPQTVIFALKQEGAELSDHLDEAEKNRQLHRLDVDVLETGAWEDVLESIHEKLKL